MKSMRWKRAAKAFAVIIFSGVLSLLAFAIFKNYEAYTKMVVAQQQQHLLITARAVAQNLSLYLSEQMRDIDILIKTPGFLDEIRTEQETGDTKGLKEYLLSYMLSQDQELARIYLLDAEGNELFHYSQYPFLTELDQSELRLSELAARHQRGLGFTFRVGEQHYGLTVINNIMNGSEHVGTVVTVIDMRKLYQNFVEPLERQGLGDIIVKNDKGTIVMHPDERMIGFNADRNIEGISELPQYESMRTMLEEQYTYEEGSARYRSYANGILPSRDEIASFSRMNLEGTTWYVSAVMPYSEVIQMVRDNLGRFGLLVTAILITIAAAVISIYALQKNRQKLQMEARYLKEINSTLAALQESREQVQHFQKIQTIGALASGIVHEFNNLLIPILGYSEFLKKQLGTESEYYEDIDEIHEAGMRAKEIVEQILPFSRKETDALSYGPVSLEVVLQDVLKTIRILLPAGTMLSENLSETHMTVFGSATQLHQVFLNLGSNAFQAVEKKHGSIMVRSAVLSQDRLPENFHPLLDGDYAVVEIADTGDGISEAVLPHIFDPFFTTKAKGEGTGLGLSVVREILISHKGFIEVKSEEGKGSRFLVYLPLYEADGKERS